MPDAETAAAHAAPPLRLTYGLRTDTGLARGAQGNPNEDSLAAVLLDGDGSHSNTLALFMVADGVGGAAAGEVASQRALQILTREWTDRILLPFWSGEGLQYDAVRAELLAGFAAANTSLLEYQSAHGAPIGTTLTAAIILQTQAYIVNVGDSRTYLLRDGTFAPVTRDHSYVALLVANGLLRAEDVYSHPQRNIILSSLGDANSTPDIFPLEGGALSLVPGDQLLLCSDGLWEMVRDHEMQRVLMQAPDAESACAELVQMANTAGGADNISAIVIRIRET
jgi:protein phosphatase